MARFDRKKREFLVAKLGEERVRQLEEGLSGFAKELETRGVRWKDDRSRVRGQQLALNSPATPYVAMLAKPQPLSAKAFREIADSHPIIGGYLADVVRMTSRTTEGSTE